MNPSERNRLYFGDNIDFLRDEKVFPSESVQLIYLDPPFNSNKVYNVLFEERNGTGAAAQIRAFEDTWHWGVEASLAFDEAVKCGPGKLVETMKAFRSMLGGNDMLAYLSMMAPRLVYLHRILRSTGSIFLHCDPTASHYLKVLMDSVFGAGNFRNEIIWHYSGWNKKNKTTFNSRHDTILMYGKGEEQAFNSYAVPWENAEEYVRVRKQKVRTDSDGRDYVLSDRGGGKRIRRYLEDALESGAYVDDVWDLDKLNNSAKESLKYPTQKPEALLERIIASGSNEGDLVLDPFCGCGTSISVAQRMNRKWFGIDITYLAIGLVERRLKDAYGREIKDSYEVIGKPKAYPDAVDLARRDKYQFQWWALDLVDARGGDEKKKGADRGVDGEIFFQEFPGGPVRSILLQVKGGQNVHREAVATLKGDMQRGYDMGVLIMLEEPTAPMVREAADAGVYTPDDPIGAGKKAYPRVQILTVQEIMEQGKRIDYPEAGNITFRRAPAAVPKKGKTQKLQVHSTDAPPPTQEHAKEG